MKPIAVMILIFAILLGVGVLEAQVTYNPNPARVLGHPRLTLTTLNPNLVEGRELFAAQSVALDTSANPPIVYVADTLNNRVLGWRDATSFTNGAFADVVAKLDHPDRPALVEPDASHRPSRPGLPGS